MPENYRLYSFVNALYMKEIQWGIQTAHVIPEIYTKYTCHEGAPSLEHGIIGDWASRDKTIIILNGGIYEDLRKIRALFTEVNADLRLPWAYFEEDQQSLGGILTAVGIIVPEYIYGCVNYRTALNAARDRLLGTDFEARFRDKQDAWFFLGENGEMVQYHEGSSAVGRLLATMKSCRLAGM